jgi:hypothetical protein
VGSGFYEIGWADDPQKLARRITWAKVTGIEGRTIRVAATPLIASQRRPPDSDFVGQVLFDLKSPKQGRARQALGRLQRTPSEPARQTEVASAVEPMLKDPDEGARVDALKSLAVWGGKENTPAILTLTARSERLRHLGGVQDPGRPEGPSHDRPGRRIPGHRPAPWRGGPDAQGDGVRGRGRGHQVPGQRRRDDPEGSARGPQRSIGTEKCIPALQGFLRKAGDRGIEAMFARLILNRLGAPP